MIPHTKSSLTRCFGILTQLKSNINEQFFIILHSRSKKLTKIVYFDTLKLFHVNVYDLKNCVSRHKKNLKILKIS